ncbi:hypothetical protein NAEX_05488 [Nannocystis exedens]|nr:hypothetical protein NAEX_05488 [Nannocystis exedens]
MKSGVSKPKLTSTCQPASPGSAGDGKRTGNVPSVVRGHQRSRPTSLSKASWSTAVLAAATNGGWPN